MVSPSDDLDLTQARAYALQPAELAELLGTVDASLTLSLSLLRAPPDMPSLHRALHDVKGYVGLVASGALCELVQQADQAARQEKVENAHESLQALIPRLERLQTALEGYRAGIIGA
jgi:HPt (histidine-containing phosphotransfer) domain-containing protein